MTDAPQYTSVTELSFLVKRTPDRIRADLKRSRFEATKIGRDWQFTPTQAIAARLYYSDLGAAEEQLRDAHGA